MFITVFFFYLTDRLAELHLNWKNEMKRKLVIEIFSSNTKATEIFHITSWNMLMFIFWFISFSKNNVFDANFFLEMSLQGWHILENFFAKIAADTILWAVDPGDVSGDVVLPVGRCVADLARVQLLTRWPVDRKVHKCENVGRVVT